MAKATSKQMALPMPANAKVAEDGDGEPSAKRQRLDPWAEAIKAELASLQDNWPVCCSSPEVPPSSTWLQELPEPGPSWFYSEALHIQCQVDAHGCQDLLL